MAENRVAIDATSVTPVPTYSVSDAVVKNVYIFSIGNRQGVAGANNYLSIENPSGSAITVVILGAFMSANTNAASTTPSQPMRGNRATALSGGTVQAVSAIAKGKTSMPDPTGVVRTANPTATLGPQVFNYPAPMFGAAGTIPPFAVSFGSVPGGFTLAPGEGLVINSTNDDISRDWHFSLLWGEI